ncbi:MAG: hypothetical protein H6719_15945 [Sandaracinaceae bacterium]|nr:hypothetical protein [Sandaracinaceae bacterium]
MNDLFSRGYLTLFKIKGVPIRAHWSVPLVCLAFSRFRFEPGLWVGILVVILLHELGHAFLVWRMGLVNLGIDLTGFGGLCRWTGHPTEIQRAGIAWGGVLAQLALFVVATVVLLVVGEPTHPWLRQLVEAFTTANLFIAAFNLVPIRPFDGGEAWPLFRHLWRRRQARRKWKKKLVKADDDDGDDPLSQTLRQALADADRKKKS